MKQMETFNFGSISFDSVLNIDDLEISDNASDDMVSDVAKQKKTNFWIELLKWMVLFDYVSCLK